MSGNKDKLIAFNYFGGKFVWLEYLYDNFPPHFTHLIDLFAGSLCVSLNYRGRVIRTANEINGEITNFFEILRDHEEELIRRLSLTPHSELEYLNSWGNTNSGKIEQARRFYVRARQSFYGLGAQAQSKGWHMTKQHVNAQGGETISRWNNGIGKLHTVAAEIRKISRSPIPATTTVSTGSTFRARSSIATRPIRWHPETPRTTTIRFHGRRSPGAGGAAPLD